MKKVFACLLFVLFFFSMTNFGTVFSEEPEKKKILIYLISPIDLYDDFEHLVPILENAGYEVVWKTSKGYLLENDPEQFLAIFVVLPSKGFKEGEIDVLVDYVKKGGNLVGFGDNPNFNPEWQDPFNKLFRKFGIEASKVYP
ncbi:MAG: hypothetical protein ACE5K0_12100, partial [Candidatus Methanofastidiosia archaeon]